MSCSRPAVWTSSWSSVGEPGRGGDLARVAGDGGAVARGHPVAQVERAQQRAEQRDLEAGELLGAQLELVGALLGDEQGADQVLEDEEHDAEQGDGRGARPGRRRQATPSASSAAASSDGSSGEERRGGPWSRSWSAST